MRTPPYFPLYAMNFPGGKVRQGQRKLTHVLLHPVLSDPVGLLRALLVLEDA